MTSSLSCGSRWSDVPEDVRLEDSDGEVFQDTSIKHPRVPLRHCREIPTHEPHNYEFKAVYYHCDGKARSRWPASVDHALSLARKRLEVSMDQIATEALIDTEAKMLDSCSQWVAALYGLKPEDVRCRIDNGNLSADIRIDPPIENISITYVVGKDGEQ